MKNEEITNVKKIMGLQHNKVYSDVTSLRYGRIMIMTDQVGFHICGLLFECMLNYEPGS